MKLPPTIQPPAGNLLSVTPPDLPNALRKRLDACLAGWRQAITDRDGAVADLAKLSALESIPADMTGAKVIEARAAAERRIAAAVLDFVQAVRRLAVAFGEVLPHAEKRLATAAAAVQSARVDVARKVRGADLLLSDEALGEALATSAEVRAADEARQTAAGHLAHCKRLASPQPQQAERWARRYLRGAEAAASEGTEDAE